MKRKIMNRTIKLKQKGPRVFRIKLEGLLPLEWTEWFEDYTISYEDNNTFITGSFKDQSQLHGILNRVRDLNLFLLSVEVLETPISEEQK